MTTTGLALASGAERKRLGQYFTGLPLARVLAALAGAVDATTVIDPMGGSGDMLAACLDEGCTPSLIASIEIDSRAAQLCRERFQVSDYVPRVIEGSAFVSKSWSSFGNGWDLVITNPPYVRYQAGARASGGLPAAQDVRDGLIAMLDRRRDLSAEERATFRRAATNYSGLADLAVPSWILCMSAVPVGGRLAMVVPNTWLSRRYSAWVVYLLRRYFDVEVVVEDADAAWFEDALVRTTLVVAKRVPDKGTAVGDGGHWYVRVSREASNEHSLVGTAFPGEGSPEKSFRDWILDHRGPAPVGLEINWSDESDLRSAIVAAGIEVSGAGPSVHLPQSVRERYAGDSELLTLEQLGWSAGQGMRTGANDFFYVSRGAGNKRFSSSLLPGESLRIPTSVLKPAILRQSELPDSGFVFDVGSANSFLLCLDGLVLPEDDPSHPRRHLKGDLQRLVRAGAKVTYERGAVRVGLPDLSAVRTNVRHATETSGARFWYQLPALTPRHRPSLFMARINSGSPRCYMNPDQAAVVDANFISLWQATDGVSVEAMLALLNSDWAAAWFEAACTVLGGGALKVEAADLRRLVFPADVLRNLRSLHEVGRRLVVTGKMTSAMRSKIATAAGYPLAMDKFDDMVKGMIGARGKPR